jgi:hypothetical protein
MSRIVDDQRRRRRLVSVDSQVDALDLEINEIIWTDQLDRWPVTRGSSLRVGTVRRGC